MDYLSCRRSLEEAIKELETLLDREVAEVERSEETCQRIM